MNEDIHPEPRTRRDRLAAIAARYTEEIHDPRTRAQLREGEPIYRYAAVTSGGRPEPTRISGGNLIVAATNTELAERLRRELAEGRLAHGRAWDLDAPWRPYGNVGVACPVLIGDVDQRPIQIVRVDDGRIYLFDDLTDAEAFADELRRQGVEPQLSEELLHDHHGADRLIAAERRR